MQTYRFFTIENHGDATVARAVDTDLRGTAQAAFVKEELIRIMQSTKQRLVVDFERVKMISSPVIASLLIVKSRTASDGKRLSLTMTESLRSVFAALNMDGTVFNIYTSASHALTSSPHSGSYYDVCGQVSPPDEEYDVTVTE